MGGAVSPTREWIRKAADESDREDPILSRNLHRETDKRPTHKFIWRDRPCKTMCLIEVLFGLPAIQTPRGGLPTHYKSMRSPGSTGA
jgi:hypothetical protein